MRKIYAFLIAIVLTLFSVIGLDFYFKKQLTKNIDKLYYYNHDNKNSNDFVMENVLKKETIAVLGSSELFSDDKIAYPPYLYNYGYSNYNTILIGRGYMQSIHHAMSVGALSNNIKNNKVVLIISPQWFTESHLSSDIYSSRFSEPNYIEFLKNKNISKENKMKVAERLENLLKSDPTELEKINKYEDTYLYHSNINPIDFLKLSVYSDFMKLKENYNLAKELKKIKNSINYDNFVDVNKIDYAELLKKAEKVGKSQCTTNEFGIKDDYFNTYVKEKLKVRKNSDVNASYLKSKEYEDLQLFLDICKDLNIEPLLISIPVNGRWYDYTGFSKEDRAQYYQNIRNIASINNVELADFSDKEYELYFLKDVMHLGWKGWVYLDEAIYNFYQK